MRLFQRRGNLRSERKHFLFRQRPRRQAFRQGRPRDVLHHQEVHPVLAPELMRGFDIGMIHFRQCEGFFAEALAGGFVGQRARRQNLQGHVAVELLVVGAIHHTHPAFTDFPNDAVVAECEANHGEGNPPWGRNLRPPLQASQRVCGDGISIRCRSFVRGPRGCAPGPWRGKGLRRPPEADPLRWTRARDRAPRPQTQWVA